ncbi:hypothetical protein KIN20_031091 [Parelaphostrongylus tenuis]|uniref:Serine-threonine/tyrosine-protein kinase catalytic domain-containing protein n=1 Tax=Parelaphostrongylus tenuis TaxID=148309 RepID=A0AAD5R525_PARTN|nr:hypothetical protein KIN20_031091 [Parelaphostrongylus tenuis]
MWEVFHDGMTPYDKFPNTAAIRRFVLAGNRLNNESDKYPEYLWNLTQACWKQDGADRPDFRTYCERHRISNGGLQRCSRTILEILVAPMII